jgi:lipopolysaccharide biosynthesis regulator YciM
MRSGLSSFLRNPILAFAVLAAICSPIAGYSGQEATPPQAQALDDETYRIQAYAHHGLALLYLAKGEVDKALVEARAIIQPPIPPAFDKAVAESICKIADKLKDLRRFDLAQTLLDETLKVTVQIPNRVSILKVKSRLFLLAGEESKAIDAWKRAVELEAKIRQ